MQRAFYILTRSNRRWILFSHALQFIREKQLECRLFLAISTHIFDWRFQERYTQICLACTRHRNQFWFLYTFSHGLLPVVQNCNVKPLTNLNGYENDIRDALYTVWMRKWKHKRVFDDDDDDDVCTQRHCVRYKINAKQTSTIVSAVVEWNP